MSDPAVVFADGTCALCDSTGQAADGTPCPCRDSQGSYVDAVTAAARLLRTLAEETAPETWREVVACWPAIDDLYRAVSMVKRRAIAAGMNLAQHGRIDEEEHDG